MAVGEVGGRVQIVREVVHGSRFALNQANNRAIQHSRKFGRDYILHTGPNKYDVVEGCLAVNLVR